MAPPPLPAMFWVNCMPPTEMTSGLRDADKSFQKRTFEATAVKTAPFDSTLNRGEKVNYGSSTEVQRTQRAANVGGCVVVEHIGRGSDTTCLLINSAATWCHAVAEFEAGERDETAGDVEDPTNGAAVERASRRHRHDGAREAHVGRQCQQGSRRACGDAQGTSVKRAA